MIRGTRSTFNCSNNCSDLLLQTTRGTFDNFNFNRLLLPLLARNSPHPNFNFRRLDSSRA